MCLNSVLEEVLLYNEVKYNDVFKTTISNSFANILYMCTRLNNYRLPRMILIIIYHIHFFIAILYFFNVYVIII